MSSSSDDAYASYNRTIRGPDLDIAFRVTSGLVAIVGSERSVVWPMGMVWPGVGTLPEELMGWLAPAETHLTPEAEWEACVPNERDIEVALALLQVQRLQSREMLIHRMEYLSSWTNPNESSHYTVAALLGTTRETLTKTISLWRVRRRQAAD